MNHGIKRMSLWVTAGVVLVGVLPAMGQTSSLFVTEREQPSPVPQRHLSDAPLPVAPLSPAIARVSLTAVRMPAPPIVAMNDLVTIIVNENTEADSTSKLETKKSLDLTAQVTDFPKLRLLHDFISLLSATDITDNPKVAVGAKDDFKGEGDYNRKDTFSTRLTARVVDIKPNGTLVLEARKYIKTDKETLAIMLTGTARVQDITATNTILSTQLYDLHLEKKHTGEVRSANKKGFLTKIIEALFNF